jgi:hypothetical protein
MLPTPRPPQSRAFLAPPDPHHPHVRAWQAHVDAGRIGTRPAPAPEAARIRRHNVALLANGAAR